MLDEASEFAQEQIHLLFAKALLIKTQLHSWF